MRKLLKKVQDLTDIARKEIEEKSKNDQKQKEEEEKLLEFEIRDSIFKSFINKIESEAKSGRNCVEISIPSYGPNEKDKTKIARLNATHWAISKLRDEGFSLSEYNMNRDGDEGYYVSW